MRTIFAGWMLGLCVMGAACADMVIGPKTLVFENKTDPKTINITSDGKPLPVDAIRHLALRVGDNEYNDFFTTAREPGKITLTPTEKLVPGTYDLVVRTDDGIETIKIIAPLAARLAPTGTAPASAGDLDALVAPVYYSGSTLALTKDAPVTHAYIWSVNNKSVTQGVGPSAFSYTFTAPGTYTIGYQESENGNTVLSGTTSTLVVTEPPIAMTAAIGAPVLFHGPTGYATYTWSVDNAAVATTMDMTYTFANAGNYNVMVNAKGAASGPQDAYRTINYLVTVQ